MAGISPDYDVIIAGGGMVGAALACCLGGSDLKVAVLDAAGPPRWEGNDYALRVSAITPASIRLLKKLKAWDVIAAERYAPIDAMHIWEGEDSERYLDFDSAEIGAENMGVIIENRVVQSALLRQAQTHSNVRYLSPASVAACNDHDDWLDVQLENGDHLTTRLLVGADGARSKVRELAHIDTYGWSFDQTAIVFTVKTEKPHDHVARQTFLSTGPLAFLPLDDAHTCSNVWSADTDEARRLLSLSDDEFRTELQHAFGDVLGNIEWVSERAGFPLTLAHAKEYIGHRVALIGDALHRIHPLAGQGVNLGFGDAAVLAEVILNAHEKRRDIGERHSLRPFERWRKETNHKMIGLMDLFKRSYGSRQPAIISLRRLGLDLTNRIAPIKHWFMRQASGLENELPKRFY
ncbi:MAG: UbiH/UbiF/VisC/COQ6 family ubiquinone biosynthesis hydroxylase [Gammaproteobacteria bacterium]|nr:UbiH/UbiF/VisC/COQ6 family ubiquinone biosynthesis hydroxylase [Gammaproteobacteria bacterium]